MGKAFVSNIKSVTDSLRASQARANDIITHRYQNLVRKMLKDLASHTPQWSGDLAASWQVLVGRDNQTAHDKGYTTLKTDLGSVKFIGDPAAVTYAVTYNEPAIQRIRWNSVVSIQNASKTLVGDMAEGNPPLSEEWLRDGNFIPGDFMAVNFVAAKYARKGSNFKVG